MKCPRCFLPAQIQWYTNGMTIAFCDWCGWYRITGGEEP